jgi:hypothetical protein
MTSGSFFWATAAGTTTRTLRCWPAAVMVRVAFPGESVPPPLDDDVEEPDEEDEEDEEDDVAPPSSGSPPALLELLPPDDDRVSVEPLSDEQPPSARASARASEKTAIRTISFESTLARGARP